MRITEPNQQQAVPVELPAGFSSNIFLSVNGSDGALPTSATVRVLIKTDNV